MHGYLSTDFICSEMQIGFQERISSKTVSFEEQIMFKDEYMGIFPRQMGAIVFIILQIFLNAQGLKMFTNSLPFTAYEGLLFCVFWYNFMNEKYRISPGLV